MVKGMANPMHVTALMADVDEWNRWRTEEPDLLPDLSGADLQSTDLSMADLKRAILRGANLMLANLKGADLRWADLRKANLVGARLIGADLQGADLRGTNLTTADDLTYEQLGEAIGDESTGLPEDTPRPLRWTADYGAR